MSDLIAERIWSEIEASAWRRPERLTLTELAERDIMLPAEDNPEPGPYRAARTPYARGIQDSAIELDVEAVTCVMGVQVCKTTILMNLAYFYTAQEPSPVLITMATEESFRRFFDHRFRRYIEQSPGFSRLLRPTKTASKGATKDFVGSTIYGASAGQIALLASTPIRAWLGDEVDDYPNPPAGHAQPAELAEQRTTNFRNRKLFRASSPTTPSGVVWVSWLDSLQHLFYVPCPHCFGYQVLTFRGNRDGEARERLGPFYGVKWPEGERDWLRVDSRRLAWYECEHCGGRIENHQKAWMLARGVWLAIVQDRRNAEAYEDAHAQEFLSLFGDKLREVCQRSDVEADAVLGGRMARVVRDALDPEQEIEWEAPWATHLGYRLSGLYSPFAGRAWRKFAAAFLKAQESRERLKTFRQLWCALPWLEDVVVTSNEMLRAHVEQPIPAGVVPDGYDVLTAGVDVHGYRYHVVVWAWNAIDCPHLVMATVVDTEDLAERLIVSARFPLASNPADGLQVAMAFWDSGWATDEQYEFCRRHPDRVRPIKGQPGTRLGGRQWRITKIETSPRTGRPYPSSLVLVNVNVDHYKDNLILSRLPKAKGTPGSVQFNGEVSDEFLLHLTAEQKQRRTIRRTGAVLEEWAPVEGRPNHFLDASVYGIAAADFIGARRIAPGSVPSRSSSPPSRPTFLRRWKGLRK